MKNRLKLLTDMVSHRKLAEQMVARIKQTLSELDAATKKLNHWVNEHEHNRVELVKLELASRKLTWCTRCNEITPKDTAQLYFVEGASECLHRNCPDCSTYVAHLSGDQMKLVKARRDGFYFLDGEEWKKVPERYRTSHEIPDTLVYSLTKEWNLSPAITCTTVSHSVGKLVIFGEDDKAKTN